MEKKTVVAKKYFDFGKIALYGNRKINQVNVEVELRKHEDPDYYEFSACCDVWNFPHTDIVWGGQCLDGVDRYLTQMKNKSIWKKIFRFWKKYHLNDMHAGTPEQEEAIREWKAAGNNYDYSDVCEYLKSIGLYEVLYTGKTSGKYIDNELVKYGHYWFVQDIPEDDLNEIIELLNK